MNWQALARRYARKYGLDESIFQRQMGQEAHGEDLTSPAGALGPAQIMPGTAQAWGVKNPHDINQAYDAAAKHMAEYVDKYGSIKNALIAYNAGPGAVGGKLPGETQHYLATILNGRDQTSLNPTTSVGTQAASPQSSGRNPFDAIAALGSGQDDAVAAGWRMLSDLWNRKNAGSNSLELPNVLPGSNAGDSTGLDGLLSKSRPSNQLLELFYDPLGGVKHGREIGAIGGHDDHVHVAAGPKQAVALGKLAQSMGLHVGENPAFGGVAPVHVQGSYHYKDEADDVSGDPKTMAEFYRRVKRIYGVK